MSNASMMHRAAPRSGWLDVYGFVSLVGFIYNLLLVPLTSDPLASGEGPGGADVASVVAKSAEGNIANRLFWPTMALIAIALSARHFSRLRSEPLPRNITCLLIYVAYVGMTILWAFSPSTSFVRYVAQLSILTATVLPIMVSARTTDMVRAMFACFAITSILNIYFVFAKPPSAANNEFFGYTGYFTDKNALGQVTALSCVLAFNEIANPGFFRRAFGIVVLAVSAWLVIISKSKTSLALAILAPFLAGIMLIAGKKMRVSSATVLLSIFIGYKIFSTVTGISIVDRISYMAWGSPNYSGRTYIWDFLATRIEQRPLLGWGYQSFWRVGAGGPSLAAGGWIGSLPHGHNGYMDVIVETGKIGFLLFMSFLVTTLYAIGRVADQNPRRAWALLSLAYFVILDDFLESVWMRGSYVLWLVFLVIAAQAARDVLSSPQGKPAYGARARPSGLGLQARAGAQTRLGPQRGLGRFSKPAG